MLLNGWKEIARHFQSSVRTVQRWQAELRMPVMRVRRGKRGPVAANSEALDNWMKRQASTLSADQRTSEFETLKRQATQEGHDFLWMELATSRNLVRLAQGAINDNEAVRRRKAARKAYDSIRRHLSFTKGLAKAERNQFNAEFQELKAQLQKLGESF